MDHKAASGKKKLKPSLVSEGFKGVSEGCWFQRGFRKVSKGFRGASDACWFQRGFRGVSEAFRGIQRGFRPSLV